MAGETVQQTTGYGVALSAEALEATTVPFTTAATINSIVTAVGTVGQYYPLLDFQLVVTGAPAADTIVNMYRRRSDGTTPEAAPSGTNKQQYIGSFTIDAVGTYYFRGAVNSDPNDTIYLESTHTTAATYALNMRARSYNAAA